MENAGQNEADELRVLQVPRQIVWVVESGGIMPVWDG
jgi:hypothetical protein